MRLRKGLGPVERFLSWLDSGNKTDGFIAKLLEAVITKKSFASVFIDGDDISVIAKKVNYSYFLLVEIENGL